MRYFFEDFALDTESRELLRGVDAVGLEPQVFDLLVYLIRNRDRVVSRDDLLASIWEGRLVSESALNTRIYLARSAIGDNGTAQRLIRTFTRKGIRFMGAVREDQAAATKVPWMRWPGQRATSPTGALTMMAAPTITMLPFTTVDSPSEPRFLPPLDVEIRSELARVHRGFDLIIRWAGDGRDRPSPEIVDRLGVRYFVAGTMWLDGAVERANIQLIEVETDRQIWSEPFEFERGHSGAMNRLAARIARLLVIQVRDAESSRPLPVPVEAGHYVLQGRALYETERGAKSTQEAHSLFKKALQLDANSIAALQGCASTRLIQVHNGWIPWEQRPSALIEAEETIERLVKLDPGNAASHYLRASLLRALGKPDEAIASLEHALLLNPNYSLAHAQLGRVKIDAGRAHEAMAHIEEAIRLSPPEPNIHVHYFWAGLAALHIADDRAALQWLLKSRQANPSFTLSALMLAVAYLGMGNEERARATLAEFRKSVPEFTIASWTRWRPTQNATVAKQRERIRDAWRRLDVPDDEPAMSNR